MKLFATTALCIFVASSASAITLDFSGVQGSNTGTVSVPGATINHSIGSANILVGPGAASQTDGFCFTGSGCAADGEMIFDAAVSNLTFDIDGWNPGDSVEIFAYNGLTLLGSSVFAANIAVDFSAFGSITRLFFDDQNSTAFGVGYSTFTFDAATPAVPLPASLPLLLAGFGVVAARSRAKRR